MSDVSASLHDEVVRRAGNRCEYCGLSQVGQEAAFHLDHVLPRTAERGCGCKGMVSSVAPAG
jgi:hypothetical protein